MVREEKLNKALYKLQLYTIKVIPMVMTFISLLNTILSYYDIDLPILSYIGGYSLLTILFLYLSSYVFKFCMYHRLAIHYITINWILNTYDTYIGIPLLDRELFSCYLILTGIFIVLIIWQYVKNNSKVTKRYS